MQAQKPSVAPLDRAPATNPGGGLVSMSDRTAWQPLPEERPPCFSDEPKRSLPKRSVGRPRRPPAGVGPALQLRESGDRSGGAVAFECLLQVVFDFDGAPPSLGFGST